MALKVSAEQRIFDILRRKQLEILNNFSLTFRPELEIANFLITILRIFCDSVIQSFLNFRFQ